MTGISLLTWVHVLISLMAIASGCVVVHAMATANRIHSWTTLFLTTTLLTSLTGFLFPFTGFTPALAFGVLSIALLIPTLLGFYAYRLAGSWRWIYVIGATLALYLNAFVLVVQAFLKIPALNALAPKGNEPPFAIVQAVVLVIFAIAGLKAVKGFKPVAA